MINIELRNRRCVARSKARGSHRPVFLDALHRFGIFVKGERKIGDGTESDNFHLVGIRLYRFNDKINSALILSFARGMNQVLIPHTILAVNAEGFTFLAGICSRSTCINRGVAARHFQRHQRVFDCLIETDVSCGNCHAKNINVAAIINAEASSPAVSVSIMIFRFCCGSSNA